MRSLIGIFGLLLSTAIADVVPQQAVSLCAPGYELCPARLSTGLDNPIRIPALSFGHKKPHWTNAQRLARGLPLRTPVRHNPTRIIHARQDPSSIPIETRTGVIGVFSGDTPVGFISGTTQSGATYRIDDSLMGAAIFSVKVPIGATNGNNLRVSVTGSDISGDYPILGLVQGSDNVDVDINVGSYHYLYFAGISEPGAGPMSVPSLLSNSYSDWNIDLTNGEMSADWVNSDGTSASGTSFFSQGSFLYAGGDINAFADEYAAPVLAVTLRFIM